MRIDTHQKQQGVRQRAPKWKPKRAVKNSDRNTSASFEIADGLKNALWMSRLFVAIQIATCFVLGLGHRGRIVAALVVAISTIAGNRFKLTKSLHTYLVVVSGILFACFAVSRFLGEQSAGLLDLFELLAEYLILVQSLELLRKRSSNLAGYHEANYLPGLGTITITMLLVSRDLSLSPSTQVSLFMGFVVLLLLVTRPDFVDLLVGNRLQRRKAATLATIAVVGLSAGALFRGEVTRQLPMLQAALRTIQPPTDEFERVMIKTNARFVEKVTLSSISHAQRTAPDELVFSVEAAQFPGYLRTVSFEKFDGSGWSNHWDIDRRAAIIGVKRILPRSEIPAELAAISMTQEAKLYELPNRRSNSYVDMKILVPKGRGLLVPLPLTAAYVIATSEARTNALVLDVHGNVWPNSINNGDYRVFAGATSNGSIDDTYANRLLQLPAGDADYIKSLSTEILGSAQTTREKTALLEDYFRNNFVYSFDEEAIGERNGRSPLRTFLENRKAGHCEYFATATTLLLRAQGVACRLSTGYLVYEMNRDREYYFARNRNAHAWAEAYDEPSGSWILVESTPGIQEYVDRFRSNDTQFVQADGSNVSSEQSLANNLRNLFATLQTGWSLVLASRFSWLIPLALGGVYLRIRAHRGFQTSKRSQIYTSREVRKADRLAQRMGYKRAAGETCLQFASRLSESVSSDRTRLTESDRMRLAEWYVNHSQSRYRN